MARKETFASWAGIGAAVLLAATAARFAVAADHSEPPPPAEHGAWHGRGAGAGPGMMMPGIGQAMMVEHMADRLGLSTAQREAVHKAIEEARPGFEALHGQMRKDAEQAAHTRPDDPGYQAMVAAASQSASQTAGQFVLQASQLRSRVFGVLTPAQRDQATKLEAEHLARMQEGEHGKHIGGHGADGMEHPGRPGPDAPPPPPPAPAPR